MAAAFELTARPALKLKIQKPRPPLEREDQVAYFKWLYYGIKYNGARVWDSAFMIANGGYKHVGSSEQRALQGKAMGAQGLKPGVPDIYIAIAVPPWHGMFLEMKRLKARKPTDTQVSWHVRLTAAGYFVRVCYGLTDAQAATLEYFNLLQPS